MSGLEEKEAIEALDYLIGEWSEDPVMEEAVIDAVQKVMRLYKLAAMGLGSSAVGVDRLLNNWIADNTRPTGEPL